MDLDAIGKKQLEERDGRCRFLGEPQVDRSNKVATHHVVAGLTGGIIAQLEAQASCLQSMSKSKFATLSDGHEVEQKAARILAVVASDKRNSSCSSACKLLSSCRNSKRGRLFDVTTR